MFTIVGYRPQPPPHWCKVNIFGGPRPRLSEIEHEEDHCLEAMLHWHDPSERLRNDHRRCHTHTLVDDNPASG